MTDKPLNIRLGLGYKFVLPVVAILAITLSSTMAYVVFTQNNSFQEHLNEKGKILGYFVSLISPEAILGYDFAMLNDFMKEITHQNDMVFGVILDPTGKNITSYLDKENAFIAAAIPAHGENINDIIATLRNHRSIITMNFPIIFEEESIGTVLVGVSTNRLEQQATQTLVELLSGNIAVIVFLSIAIFMVFRYNVLRPIKVLMLGSERVAEGNLEENVVVYSADELGLLTRSFNQMMHKLGITLKEKDNAFKQLQELNKTLEQRVEMRTQELKRSETRIRAILENLSEGVFTINRKGIIESANPAAERIFNYSKDEMLGLHNMFLMSDMRADEINKHVDFDDEHHGLFKISENRLPTEYEGRRSDGSLFPMEVMVSPMELDSVRLRVCMVRDITERKVAEQRLENAQKQLLDAAHNAGMAEIATGVLHNIRNVLNSVNLSATEIRRIATDSKVSGLIKANALLEKNKHNIVEFFASDKKGKLLPEYYLKVGMGIDQEINAIVSESENLVKKVEMMRDVISTQQEYAKSGYFAEQLSVEALIKDALSVQDASLRKANVQVDIKITPELKITVNKSKLLQVIMNIVKNAKEAMQDNELLNKPKRLTIEAGKLTDTDVYISLTDNGIGIKKENLTSIFNHGFTTKENGHGFGLHTSANAITEICGKIFVDSKGLHCGATFRVVLPIEDKQLSKDLEKHAGLKYGT